MISRSRGLSVGCGLAVIVLLSLAALVWADSFDRAYRDQRQSQLQMLDGTRPFGFKAGLTSPVSRETFGSDRSVAGVLRQGHVGGRAFSVADFGKGRVEMELAYQLGEPVSEPIVDVASLRAKVVRVAPALEFPDLAVLGGKPDSVLAIVRGNVAAHSAVVGPSTELARRNPDALLASLYVDGKLLSESGSNTVIGGQWHALLTLVNTLVAAGWTVYPDQWLLTGALDGMHELRPGRYRLVIGALGELEVDVTDRVNRP